MISKCFVLKPLSESNMPDDNFWKKKKKIIALRQLLCIMLITYNYSMNINEFVCLFSGKLNNSAQFCNHGNTRGKQLQPEWSCRDICLIEI